MSKVSVIIPVYDNPLGLERCLVSLREQAAQYGAQIIVVDNGSQETPKLPSWVKLAFEPRPGSYRARNRGINEASGEVIGFLDSDCIAAPDWIAQGVRGLQTHDAVAGEVEFTFSKSDPSVVELYDSLTRITQEYFVREEGFGATANLWVRREVLDEVGPFDGTLLSGGDVEWGRRLKDRGFELEFFPSCRVGHGASSSFGGLWKRSRRAFGGRFQLERRKFPFSRSKRVRYFGSHLRTLNNLPRSMALVFISCVLRFLEGLEWVRLGAGGAPHR